MSTQPAPVRRPVAVDSDPSMNEAPRRIRREQAVAHTLKAAALAEADGWTEGAAGFRADAARMRQAITS
ncbi:hypothetical protein [Streptomyces erythrochromogenes]|uniref:hypothetical protein n=1 Tax=Streptomyces erythrochromogenes TaxID=285574 RepID=UPI00224ED74A|nr:hypothetical protein [Streptomyces erythrochromogenes]MCX5584257.1 hypothetical protein [Streptomyces erythrochromogenes]